MADEQAGVLFIPSEMGSIDDAVYKALAKKSGSPVPLVITAPASAIASASYVSYSTSDAEVTKALHEAMTKAVTDEECPYGPAGGLHSPACFCNLSPSTREAIMWNEFGTNF